MVAISQTILSDVWADYSVKFANEYRPFIRANETQENWINEVNRTFGADIKHERKRLFSSIPERFFVTRLYKELKSKIN